MLSNSLWMDAHRVLRAQGPRDLEPQLLRGARICARNITHRYRSMKEPAVESIDLEAEPGELVALLGRSGSGKSTLLHIIAGLLKPSQGEMEIDGSTVRGPSPRWVMMFQQPLLFPWMTAADNIALGLRFNGRRSEAPPRVRELLALVELEGFGDRNVQELSGGQQQRVALARSLAPNPQALLLDEPFSALDAFTRANLQRDVRHLVRELGITVLLVTHDGAEAALMADRVLIMEGRPGRIGAEIRRQPGGQSTGQTGSFKLAIADSFSRLTGQAAAA
jgi:NitT/TauT family transport system ATP-binding protein